MMVLPNEFKAWLAGRSLTVMWTAIPRWQWMAWVANEVNIPAHPFAPTLLGNLVQGLDMRFDWLTITPPIGTVYDQFNASHRDSAGAIQEAKYQRELWLADNGYPKQRGAWAAYDNILTALYVATRHYLDIPSDGYALSIPALVLEAYQDLQDAPASERLVARAFHRTFDQHIGQFVRQHQERD